MLITTKTARMMVSKRTHLPRGLLRSSRWRGLVWFPPSELADSITDTIGFRLPENRVRFQPYAAKGTGPLSHLLADSKGNPLQTDTTVNCDGSVSCHAAAGLRVQMCDLFMATDRHFHAALTFF